MVPIDFLAGRLWIFNLERTLNLIEIIYRHLVRKNWPFQRENYINFCLPLKKKLSFMQARAGTSIQFTPKAEVTRNIQILNQRRPIDWHYFWPLFILVRHSCQINLGSWMYSIVAVAPVPKLPKRNFQPQTICLLCFNSTDLKGQCHHKCVLFRPSDI
jgi:hypothetical protein